MYIKKLDDGRFGVLVNEADTFKQAKLIQIKSVDTSTTVFAGSFQGKDVYTTPEVKTVIEHLQNEIKYLRGS